MFMDLSFRRGTNSARRYESPLITIRVGLGATARDFRVPRDILCACSAWFTNALEDDRFIEGKENLINLPEEDATVFEAFVAFAYEGFLTFGEDPSSVNARGEAFSFSLQIWNLGDKYVLPYLQNAATTQACFLLHDGTGVPLEVLGLCFVDTTETCPFRLLIADHAVHVMNKGCQYVGAKVERQLGACDGFTRAFHSSQEAYHRLPSNEFPRSLKPIKASEQLFQTEKDNYNWRPGEDSVYTCSGVWDPEARPECGECGHFRAQNSLPSLCESCQ
jgi:hypothetical protein